MQQLSRNLSMHLLLRNLAVKCHFHSESKQSIQLFLTKLSHGTEANKLDRVSFRILCYEKLMRLGAEF
jgi:hypothetical protein